MNPADARLPVLKARIDYLSGQEGRGISQFRTYLDTARWQIVLDRGLWKEVGETAFVMREFEALEVLLRFQFHVPIRLFSGGADQAKQAYPVLWTLQPNGSSTFRFSDAFETHPDVVPLIARWLQTLPLLTEFARRTDASAGQLWLNLGDMGTVPGLAFDEYREGFHLIPDPMFMESQGYAFVKGAFARESVPWEARAPIAFWRGSTTGWHNVARREIRSWRELPRILLCELARSDAAQGLVDAGLTSIVQIRSEEDREAIRATGLLKDHVPWADFQKYKYQIDIGGNTNSWDGPFIKFCTGSPVLKVQTPLGFRQWYYDRLVEWQHYVPVAADMSDLFEKLAWLRAHDEEARRIGENARRLAISMSEYAEIVGSAPTIRRALTSS